MHIRSLRAHDRAWVEALVSEHFGSPRGVSRGVLHEAHRLPGLVAADDGRPVGLLQYDIAGRQCEVVILITVRQRAGIGTALLRALRPVAEAAGCRRIWLVTTNNNRGGPAFYHAVGLKRCAVHPGAVDAARRLKPEIPERDEHSVPIVDEIEYEWSWSRCRSSTNWGF